MTDTTETPDGNVAAATQTITKTVTQTDSAELTKFNCGLTLVESTTFATKLVSDNDINQTLDDNPGRPLDGLDALDSLWLLTKFGRRILDDVPVELVLHPYPRDIDGQLDLPELETQPITEDIDQPSVRQQLTAMAADDVDRQVVRFNGYDHSLWPTDVTDGTRPHNRPYLIEVSNRHVNIDQAEPHLRNHPFVLAAARQSGRPGAFDHVPSSLQVAVKLDDDTHHKLCELARQQPHRTTTTPAGLPPAPTSSLLTEAATWYLTGDREPPAGDFLDLEQFARRHYDEPDDTDCW